MGSVSVCVGLGSVPPSLPVLLFWASDRLAPGLGCTQRGGAGWLSQLCVLPPPPRPAIVFPAALSAAALWPLPIVGYACPSPPFCKPAQALSPPAANWPSAQAGAGGGCVFCGLCPLGLPGSVPWWVRLSSCRSDTRSVGALRSIHQGPETRSEQFFKRHVTRWKPGVPP